MSERVETIAPDSPGLDVGRQGALLDHRCAPYDAPLVEQRA